MAKTSVTPSSQVKSMASDEMQIQHYMRQRAIEILFSRSKTGPIFYSIAVVLSALSQGLFYSHLAYVLAALIPLIGLALVRICASQPAPEQYANWQRVHWVLVYACVIIWGIFFAWISAHPDWSSAFIVALVCTVNFSTAIAHQFCIDKYHAMMGSLLCFLWASIAIVWLRPDIMAVLYAFGFYCIYLVTTIKKAHQEFYSKLTLEAELIATQSKLDQQARTDALTGLFNRRVFDSEMARCIAFSKRHNTPFSLILLDLDNFKALNDQHGHATGDECIKAVAHMLTQLCRRDVDIVTRIGGEEFALVLPDNTREQAQQLAQRILTAFSNLQVVDAKQMPIPITASIGVGSTETIPVTSATHMYQQVDAALYAAKHAGRNQIQLA